MVRRASCCRVLHLGRMALFLVLLLTPGLVAAEGSAAPPVAQAPHVVNLHYVHLATPENTSSIATRLDHPLLNGSPEATFFITQIWAPTGGDGVYNSHPVGVWYDGAYWSIFNEDKADMPVGAAFNVLIPPEGSTAYAHQAQAGNILANWTVLDHPLLNGHPEAVFFVTQHALPGADGTVFNPHAIGVWYWEGHWNVFNQDRADMPEGAGFNILIPAPGPNVMVHQATSNSIYYNRTRLDHHAANGNPLAFLLVTQNWNPGGVGSTYNNRHEGVWYEDQVSRWAIFNQLDEGESDAPMPEDAAFNVLVIGSRVNLPLIRH
jgi:hypothetical protein